MGVTLLASTLPAGNERSPSVSPSLSGSNSMSSSTVSSVEEETTSLAINKSFTKVSKYRFRASLLFVASTLSMPFGSFSFPSERRAANKKISSITATRLISILGRATSKVSSAVGEFVGRPVGSCVGNCVGERVGYREGLGVAIEGAIVGSVLGNSVTSFLLFLSLLSSLSSLSLFLSFSLSFPSSLPPCAKTRHVVLLLPVADGRKTKPPDNKTHTTKRRKSVATPCWVVRRFPNESNAIL
mmetsp:Transcript_22913/g.48760  ORF Transcript_22913/g.48760 Transcript_22913/m.48760 type:complete len:242 (+) Transcript_22913:1009-1734(+)